MFQDARRVQMQKLASQFRFKDFRENEKAYNKACNMIVMLQNAYDKKLDIRIQVNLEKEVGVYYFSHKVRYDIVKEFITKANTKGMTHSELAVIQEKLIKISIK